MVINYKEHDDGKIGKATEEAVKEFLGLKVCVAKAGRTDMRKARICYEVKTGAGELGDLDGKLLKGSSMVIYIPVVDENLSVDRQEGFVMSKQVFIETLGALGLIREKTSTAGARKITIQTFWNRSKNKPHGRGLAKMLDAFYDMEGEEVQTLQSWLEQF